MKTLSIPPMVKKELRKAMREIVEEPYVDPNRSIMALWGILGIGICLLPWKNKEIIE